MKILSTPTPNLVWGSSPLLLALLLVSVVASAAEKVDINTASLEELDKIKWVGPVIAQRIIDARPFYSVDELIRVNGIGEKKIADIKAQGLAWVDPNLAPSGPSPSPSTKTESEPAATLTPQPEPPAQPNNQALVPSKIDINTASSQELQKLAGIGATLAQGIIAARPFYSVEDLIRVRGIGPKTLSDIKTQGLAWVDPALQPPKIEREAIQTEKGLAAAAQPIKKVSSTKQPQKPLSVFLIAITAAVFSGVIILILKNKIKKAYNLN
jgi:competence ComEA-like helix-hairpin-helix protein